MNKIFLAILALALASSLCYAAEEGSMKATEPIGAVVEATGLFVGNVSSVVEDTATGGKAKGYVTVSSETGQTKLFPVDDTVKVVDATLNAITLNQLKSGDKVSVEYSKDKAGQDKVTGIKVVK